MKKNLLAYSRKALLQLGICTVMVLIALYNADRMRFFPAIFVGYLLAGSCWWVLVYRTWKASMQSVAQGKKEMQVGMVLRMIMFFVVLWAAISVSIEVFWSVVSGFALFSVILMVNLIAFAYNESAGKK